MKLLRYLTRLFVIPALVIVVLLRPNMVLGQTRAALVIGNAGYPGQLALQNPANDAEDIASTLKTLGFKVVLKQNADLKTMARSITEFGESLKVGDFALFYYAGHGIQAKGRNFLIPTDANIKSEAGLRSEAVDLDLLLEQLSPAQLSIVILDACRNNPFERSYRSAGGGGLAQVDAPKGSLIAYATAPGKTAADGDGRNGLYTSELLKAIKVPGARVEDVFKKVRVGVTKVTADMQIPWESSSLVGDFIFTPAKTDSLEVGGRLAHLSQDAIELELWKTVRNGSDPAEFQEYLKQFPNGRFATTASSRIAEFKRTIGQPAEDTARATYEKLFMMAKRGDLGAFAKLKALAADGLPPAQSRLGSMYINGYGAIQVDAQAALMWFKKAADQGDARGMNGLGSMYANGDGGLVENDQEAEKWFRKAAELGEDMALGNLASFHEHGRGGLKQDLKAALRLYKIAAEHGEPAAQMALGMFYLKGKGGVVSSRPEALKWLAMSAEQGEDVAQFELSKALMTSTNAMDRDSAKKWLEQAVEANNASAQATLARLYAHGLAGYPKSGEEALRWMRKAAVAGEVVAQTFLGHWYQNGSNGLLADSKLASDWYQKAVSQGFTPAEVAVANIEWNDPKTSVTKSGEIAALLKRAAESGDADGMTAYGVWFLSGTTATASDQKQGWSWLAKAAEGNSAFAQAEVGLAYLQGHPEMVKDEKKAIYWLGKATLQGHPGACAALGYARQLGLGGEPADLKEAERLYRLAANQGFVVAQVDLAALLKKSKPSSAQNLSEVNQLYRSVVAQEGNPMGKILGLGLISPDSEFLIPIAAENVSLYAIHARKAIDVAKNNLR
jgi:TPR repeat protein